MKDLTKTETPDLSFTDIAGGGGGIEFLKWITDKIFPKGAYYITNDTNFNPNGKFAGTWKELNGGIFLRSSGDTGATNYNLTSDGGSNSITLKEANLPPINVFPENYPWSGDFSGYLDLSAMASYSKGRGWDANAGNEVVPANVSVGKSETIDNQPLYKNCHIWLRTE